MALVVVAVEEAERLEVDVAGVELAVVVLVDVGRGDVVVVGAVLAVAEGAGRLTGVGVVVAWVVAAGVSAVRPVACAEAVPVSAVSNETTITVPPRRRPPLTRAPVTAAGTDGEDTAHSLTT